MLASKPTTSKKSASKPSAVAPGKDLPALTLVLGGVRSGKSRFAEGLILGAAESALYLATAEAGTSARDPEMRHRIEQHKTRRGKRWETIEPPLDLAAALQDHCRTDRPILVDCLTLWLSNILAAGRDVANEIRSLLDAVAGLEGTVIFVSNEVGLGVVPQNALARQFCDHAGTLHQELAAQADQVVFVTAGLPLYLKTPTTDS